ncbi:hypothetical protein OSB04_022285 [Centaurea solstitialis]|uniref:Uncharacterized protein n=1 Tax=Centaurea solstitialis TaxID=347529 RepID=A0AA38W5S7_9ASTR|nr:hypothetical protein OSB04_022285 [Centaurea solstitialis]
MKSVSCGNKFRGFFWKAARIGKSIYNHEPLQRFMTVHFFLRLMFETGERLSPWVAVGCFTMGVSIIFF